VSEVEVIEIHPLMRTRINGALGDRARLRIV
jgi:hypothetical protein